MLPRGGSTVLMPTPDFIAGPLVRPGVPPAALDRVLKELVLTRQFSSVRRRRGWAGPGRQAGWLACQACAAAPTRPALPRPRVRQAVEMAIAGSARTLSGSRVVFAVDAERRLVATFEGWAGARVLVKPLPLTFPAPSRTQVGAPGAGMGGGASRLKGRGRGHAHARAPRPTHLPTACLPACRPPTYMTGGPHHLRHRARADAGAGGRPARQRRHAPPAGLPAGKIRVHQKLWHQLRPRLHAALGQHLQHRHL